MSDLVVREACEHGHYDMHWVYNGGNDYRCMGGREIVLRELWEPVEAHREYDNVLTASWEFGAGADAEIPAMYVLVKEACDHDWVDATNEIIQSGKWCRKCNAVEEA